MDGYNAIRTASASIRPPVLRQYQQELDRPGEASAETRKHHNISLRVAAGVAIREGLLLDRRTAHEGGARDSHGVRARVRRKRTERVHQTELNGMGVGDDHLGKLALRWGRWCGVRRRRWWARRCECVPVGRAWRGHGVVGRPVDGRAADVLCGLHHTRCR